MAVAEELIALLGFKLKDTSDLKKWNRGIQEGVAGVGKLGGALLAVGAGAMAKQAVTGFADFERRMSRIGIAAGASVAETERVGEAVRAMSTQFAVPIDDAREGLQSLVATGMNLQQAMGFLPAVLTAAQASGATTKDLANSAQTVGQAFKIASSEMQYAFDIMVAGGNAGKFELEDMARYIPVLANRFAGLGYKGTDGLKSLVAMLQTLRERTGTAEGANTQAENLFGKIYADKTLKNFKAKGIDLRKELEKGKAAGEDMFIVLSRLINKALDGDFSKISEIADDQELQGAFLTIAQGADSLERFKGILNASDVKGSGLIAAKRIIDDTQGSIQRAENSWLRFMNTVGKAGAPGTSKGLDLASDAVEKQERAGAIRRKRGDGPVSQAFGWLLENPDDLISAEDRRIANSRQAMLTRPSRAGGRTPFAAGANTRTSGAFTAFPNAAAAPAAGSLSAATDQLRSGLNTRLGADTSSFMASMGGVQGVLRDFAAGATAVLNVDTSAAMAKIRDLQKEMRGVSRGASGSWDPPPARIPQAGAAP